MEVVLLFLAQRILQFATAGEFGVIPAAGLDLRKELELNSFEFGLLPFCAFGGIAISTVAAGWLFSRVSIASVLRSTLFLTVVGCAISSTATTKGSLYVGRFLSGCGHGPTYVFYPVWVDQCAPAGWKTSFLGIVVVMNGVGSLSFFALTTYLDSWRTSLWACFGIEALLLFGALVLPRSSLLFAQPKRVDDPASSTSRMLCLTPRSAEPANIGLLHSPVVLLLCVALALQFIALTSVEYFGTKLVVETYGTSKAYANSLYIGTGIFAMLGAPVGSVIADRLGSYQTRSTGLLLCCVYTLLPLGAFPWVLWENTTPEKTYIAVGLAGFFHTCAIPVIQGLIITTVPEKEMDASALMNLFSTIFGYMIGPPICGWFARDGTIYGWRVVWLMSLLVPVVLIAAYVCETWSKRPQDERLPLLSQPGESGNCKS